jgi:chromosome segregation ATPase
MRNLVGALETAFIDSRTRDDDLTSYLAKKRTADLEREVADLKKKLADKPETDPAADGLRRQIETLTRQLQEKDTKISSLARQITDKDTKISDLTRQSTEKDTRISGLTRQITEKDAKISSLQAAASSLGQVRKKPSPRTPVLIPTCYRTRETNVAWRGRCNKLWTTAEGRLISYEAQFRL